MQQTYKLLTFTALTTLFSCFSLALFAQNTTPRLADFRISQTGNSIDFSPIEPPLRQIAGAPPAYYSYFWEFGDGDFSRAKNPSHAYKTAGNYDAFLHMTAHYDDGDSPLGKKKGAIVQGGGGQAEHFASIFTDKLEGANAIGLISDREAKTNEELSLVLGYRNQGTGTTAGNLYLFFNEKNYPNEHFGFVSSREHYGERHTSAALSMMPDIDLGSSIGHVGESVWLLPRPVPPDYQALIERNRASYKSEEKWRFTNLGEGEERNLFISLKAKPTMLRDTNATIHLTGLFMPDDPNQRPSEFIFDIDIVSAHDPNNISVSDIRVNYRFIQAKKLDYKVRFQNDGEKNASTIKVVIEQPKSLLNAKISPQKWYPNCPPCSNTITGSCMETMQKGDSLVFIFRNIHLPGSRDPAVTDRDSTKGYVVYRLEPQRNMPKYDFKSRAHIYFDKQKPVVTNYSTTHFKAGLSPGPKVGLGFTPNENNSTYFFMGCSFAPFRSWKAYPQIELLTGLKGKSSENSALIYPPINGLDANGNEIVSYQTDSTTLTKSFISVEIPIQFRKSFSKFFSLGAGFSTQFLFKTKELKSTNYTEVFLLNGDPAGPPNSITNIETEKARETIFSPFLDLTFGAVRQGPNLGIRVGQPLGTKGGKPWVQAAVEVKL